MNKLFVALSIMLIGCSSFDEPTISNTPVDPKVSQYEYESTIAELRNRSESLYTMIVNLQNQIPYGVSVIDPCGDDINLAHEEILIRLNETTIIAYFRETRNKEYLAVLVPGEYITTDGQSCEFIVTDEFNIE